MNVQSYITYRLPGGHQPEVSSKPPVGVVAWSDLKLYLFTDLKKERNDHIFILTRIGARGEQGDVIVATDEYHQFLAAFKKEQGRARGLSDAR